MNLFFPGVITNMKVDKVDVDFPVEPAVTDGLFKEAKKPLVEEVPVKFIFTVIKEPPVPVSGRGFHKLPDWKTFQEMYLKYKKKFFLD